MRFTVVDPSGTVSFIGPDQALPALVAACAKNPTTLQELLEHVRPFVPELPERVLSGLAVFDERNSPENLREIHAAFEVVRREQVPVFRVLDARTREVSLNPVAAGVVLFNLVAKRIVQIHNTYAQIQRSGRVRTARGEQPVRVVEYELPPEWTLVPGG